ncbi:MAG: HAMP domain-containing protein [Chromatiales bacterium]|nr:HAMP domain-containing protein [Chromatiales bacterium]
MRLAISYRWRLILGFVALTSVIEASVIGVDIARAWVERNEFLAQRASILAQSTAESLRLPMWNFDELTAGNVLSALRLDPDVAAAAIHDAAGLVFVRIGDDAESASLHTQIDILAPTGSSGEAESIGHLTLALSTDRLREFLERRIIEGGLELGLLVVLNFLVIIFLLRWLTRPLTGLAEAMRRLAAHDYGVAVPYLAREDEIGRVARAIDVFKQNGLELTELQTSMERKIREQTADLIEARDAAEAGARAKSQFLATISHEIRTPMNGVLGMAQLLETMELDEDQRECVHTILESGREMMALIDDVLDFSHLDDEEMQLQLVAFDPQSLLEEVAETVRTAAQAKGLELRLKTREVPTVLGDPARLRQALSKVANNAVKFTPRGSVELLLASGEASQGRIELRFQVSDTGIGIADDQRESIFEAFQQVDQENTRAYGGAGLGLAITRRILKAMGGSIRLESQPGEGSRFELVVSLPLA